MLEVKNRTPFAAGLAPGLDKAGVEHAIVVAKGTFTIRPGKAPTVAEEQVPVAWADEPHGDAGKSSVKYAGDGALRKPATDVYVVGSAHAPRGAASHVDVGIIVGGGIKKILRVFGDRRWERRLGLWKASAPVPFESMPLVWERAYGGRDPEPPDPDRPQVDARNPVGAGFAMRVRPAEGMPLPNLEDPRALVGSPRDHPAPAGVGAVAAHWEARNRFAGTMDERWRAERFPLLPLDFDERFMQVAPPDQIAPEPLRGGELVQLVGVSRAAPALQFALPARRISVVAHIRGKDETHAAVLDTVLVEPDLERVVLTWRASIPCGRDFLRIERVRVEEASA